MLEGDIDWFDDWYVVGVWVFGLIYMGYNDFVDLFCLMFDGEIGIYEIIEEYGGLLLFGVVVVK